MFVLSQKISSCLNCLSPDKITFGADRVIECDIRFGAGFIVGRKQFSEDSF